MSALKGLTFTAYTRPDKLSAEVQRRNKLIAHLQEQLEMVQAAAKGEVYAVKTRKWVNTPDGGKTLVEANKRLKQWWRVQPNGTVLLTVRYGAKPLEFENGKAAILMKNRDELLAVLAKLIAAVEAGALDNLLSAATKLRPVTKRHVA